MSTSPRKTSLMDAEVAKKVIVYQNGNKNFPGYETVISERKYKNPDKFLDYLTEILPSVGAKYGCVRKMVSTSGKRLSGLSQIRNGGEIIACGGEGFRNDINYRSLQQKKTPRQNRGSRNNSSIMSKWYKENFNDHTVKRKSKYDEVKPRVNEPQYSSKILHIHRNGHADERACTVLVPGAHLKEGMTTVIKTVHDELSSKVGCVDYLCTTDGRRITDADALDSFEYYVAVDKANKFKNIHYMCSTTGLPNFRTHFHINNRYPPEMPFLWKAPDTRPSTLPSRPPVPPISKPSPNQSVASNPEARRRRHHDEDVHHKAVKHKRTPEKRIRQVNYDEDDSKVFKAKNPNKNTVGAKEVKETKETKTELPIDQVKAQEVQEEIIPQQDDLLELNRRPSDEDQDVSKEDLDDNDTARSGRAYSPYSKEKSATPKDLNPYKVLGPIQKDARASTPVSEDEDDGLTEAQKEQEAATKIQASYRGYQTRKQIKESQQKDEKDKTQSQNTNRQDSVDEEHAAATKIQASFRGYQTRKELQANKDKVGSVDKSSDKTKNATDEDEAAIKIQAHARGYLTRKKVQDMKEEKKKDEAATLIQANYKGFKVRKELSERKEKETKTETSQQKSEETGLTEEEAATRIQASYKGYRIRKELQKKQEEGEIDGINHQGNSSNGDAFLSTPPHSSEAPGSKR